MKAKKEVKDIGWYKTNKKVMRVMSGSEKMQKKVMEIVEFDRGHLYCEYPRGSVLEFWGENAGKEFEVKSDLAYFGYMTVFLKGEKMRFDGSPYWLMGMDEEEREWIEGALNEMSARWRALEGKKSKEAKVNGKTTAKGKAKSKE